MLLGGMERNLQVDWCSILKKYVAASGKSERLQNCRKSRCFVEHDFVFDLAVTVCQTSVYAALHVY